MREACCRIYAQICPPDLSAHVVPGIPDVLAWLGERDGVELGLLTGNYEPVARLKLRRAGIGKWFSGGGARSAPIPRTAPRCRRSRVGGRGMSARQDTIVIGDTPRDIACARADGVRCVAVTTGPYAADQLTGADAVATDVPELRAKLTGLGVGERN